MSEILQAVLMLVGSLFILIASIGILRMPDLFMRLQVTSKASVFGVTCILLVVALHFVDTVVTIRVGVIIAFLVLTIPVATHMLARAGYATGVALSEETVVNELAGHYDPATHTLSGDDPLMREIEIHPDSAVIGRRVADLGLPTEVLILLIQREGDVVVPRGDTVIERHDKLQVFTKPDKLEAARQILNRPRPLRDDMDDVDRY